MNKKAIKYVILLLIVPLLSSLIIALVTDNQGFNNKDTGYDGINIPDYNKTDTVEEIKRSDGYIYFNIFLLITISGGALIYIKQKRGI